MLAGCATSGSVPLGRDLPAADKRMTTPTVVAEPQAGEACAAVSARERSGRVDDARKLTAFAAWYETIRESYRRPAR